MYKNIEKQKVLHMAEQVDYQDGQIISRTLVQNSKLSMTLFAFEKDEEISTHAAGGDAMVTVLEGIGRFTVGGELCEDFDRPTVCMAFPERSEAFC